MKKQYAAFILALSMMPMAACGSLAEPDPDGTSSSETVYVMTTAQQIPEINASETTMAATTATTVHIGTEAPASSTPHSGLAEFPSTAVTTVSEVAAGTSIATAAETTRHTTAHHTTAVIHTAARTSAPLHTAAPVHTVATTTARATDTDTTDETQEETETTTTPVSGETKIINGIIVADYGTDHPRAIEQFSNNNKVSARYAQTLEQFKAAAGDGVNVWCMVVPTSQAFYTPEEIGINTVIHKK